MMMKKEKWIYAGALIGLIVFGLYIVIPSRPRAFTADPDMMGAAKTMMRAVDALRDCALSEGVTIDPATDINQTGLIGIEDSPITTSLGNLEAKRTSTNPNFAAVMVLLLKKAGVRRGDAVAVGASSSFPALIIATLSAVEDLGAKPVMICSLGASNWGANNPSFTWLEMLDCLREKKVFGVQPVALSIGGQNDDGSDMSEEGRALLTPKIEKSGVFFLRESGLAANVRKRMELYETSAAPARIKAFVNVGGGWADMGTDSSVLKLRPGLTAVRDIPPPNKRGVMQEMALRKTPVIHLLYVKGLADRYGLPWDPVPLPEPGEGGVFRSSRRLVTRPADSLR
jgi:poly-gamma-glutamate system protein